MKFVYEACNSEGNIVQGTLIAHSPAEAQNKLHQQGLFIIALEVDRDKRKIYYKLLTWSLTSHNKLRFLSRFTQQLSTLCHAGLPFLTCLQIITDEANHSLYKNSLVQLKYDIAMGESLAEGLAKQDHIFPQLVVQMTAAAEAAGKLEEVYGQLAALYERELDNRRKIASAAAYPLLVLLLALIGAVAISKFVLPQWQELLTYSSVPWPLPTRLLLGLGQRRAWLTFIIVLGIITFSFLVFLRTPLGSNSCDHLKLHLPFLGPLILRYHWARMCYCLALCLNCGISLLAALDIAEQASLNRSLAANIRQIKTGIQDGISLSYQLRTIKSVPKFLAPLVRVGEEAGRLAEVFSQAAQMLDKDVGHTLDKAVTWVEPLLIIVAGLVIGLIVLGLMMPLMTLVDYLG